MLWRSGLVIGNTALFLVIIIAIFWQQDWQYSLPAPRPAGIRQPLIGESISLSFTSKKPLFLHFFNPDCPCSRFNLSHLRDLIRRHGQNARFVAVLQGDGDVKGAFDKLKLGIEAVTDENSELARATGVYATPQAVLVEPNGRLYYRGNYNASRYCTNGETQFARIALESLLAGHPPSPLTPAASVAFGCPFRGKKS
jgi:hypothetical protein